jgi:perosamine synthetase
MGDNVPLTRPCMGEAEAWGVAEVLASGWITGGPKVAAFEKRVAQYVGTRHAISTTSCTTALSVALHALGIGPGDEVVVPSFSFIATANAVLHVGATPVFADIDLATYNITAETIAPVLSARTRAIMPVHQIGQPVDLDPIAALAAKQGLILLEDAACALGTEYRGRRIGGHSTCACFSFHPRKLITTGEGGMVTTNDDALAARVRTLCNHGASMTEMEKHAARGSVQVGFPVVGYNYRLCDLQGAVGLAQMDRLDGILQRRQELAAVYFEAFAELPEIVLPTVPPYGRCTYQSFMIRLRGGNAESRHAFITGLKECGVSSTPGVTAIHRQACYLERYGTCALPNTELATVTTVNLPLFPDMTEEQQQRVINAVKSCLPHVRVRCAA